MNPIVSGIYQHFPALGHKHFRRFFYAQLISLVGPALAGNSLVQTLVSDKYRGRVMGLYIFLWAGLGTFGSYVVGHMAERLGISVTLISNAAICLLAVLIVRSRILATAREIRVHVHTPEGASEDAALAPEAAPLPNIAPTAISFERQDAS